MDDFLGKVGHEEILRNVGGIKIKIIGTILFFKIFSWSREMMDRELVSKMGRPGIQFSVSATYWLR